MKKYLLSFIFSVFACLNLFSQTCVLTVSASGPGLVHRKPFWECKNSTIEYKVEYGSSCDMWISPSEGCRLKYLKRNGVKISPYTINYHKEVMLGDVNLEFVFEQTPPSFMLDIKSTGSGSASYNNDRIRNGAQSYTVYEGDVVSISFNPDEGNRIKYVKENGAEIGTNKSYTVTVDKDLAIEVAFQEILKYSISISSKGNGEVSYGGYDIRNNTKKFQVTEGDDAKMSFTPDNGNKLKNVRVNGYDVNVNNDNYTIKNIDSNTTVDVEFEELDKRISSGNLNYEITSFDNHTIVLSEGDYGLVLEVPERITYQGEEWKVVGCKSSALNSSSEIAAIIWNPNSNFDADVKNPNLLLYVKDGSYAPSYVKNVIINGNAPNIVLTDAKSGNNFYCPNSFFAKKIAYTHNYSMKTGLKESMGWETIALPFDVQKITHSTKGEIIPFANWGKDDLAKPFWLYRLDVSGFVAADRIKANEPYIISMPNHSYYKSEFILAGNVTFSSENVTVMESDKVQNTSSNSRNFVPNFVHQDNQNEIYALNVTNDYVNYQGGEPEGSKFILSLRPSYPFEAYMTSSSGTRSIGVFDDMSTSMHSIYDREEISTEVRVYNLSGTLIAAGPKLESIKQFLPSGVYIVNNEKIIIK